jgi:ribosomal protein S18 acetylase RimI-like enzyme
LDDLLAIQRIVREAYTPFIARIGKPPGPMGDDYAALVAADAVTVAERDGRVVGLLVLLDRHDHLLLDNVAVDPAAQGSGVGRSLMAYAEAEALRRGHREIQLYTNVAMTENIATYKRAGFVETGRGEASGFQRVFFAKRCVPEKGNRSPVAF